MTISRRVTGVYLIVNTTNGKVYVGSSKRSVRDRWGDHLRCLTSGKHHSQHLQRAWDKYGAKAFKFVLKEECSSEHCTIREQYWLDFYQSCREEKGYNIRKRAESNSGLFWTEEQKRIARRRWQSLPEERKVAIREVIAAKTTEHWKRPSATLRTAKASQTMRQTVRALWNDPEYRKHRKSQIISEERRKSLSERFTGRKLPKTIHAKVAKANRDRRARELAALGKRVHNEVKRKYLAGMSVTALWKESGLSQKIIVRILQFGKVRIRNLVESREQRKINTKKRREATYA